MVLTSVFHLLFPYKTLVKEISFYQVRTVKIKKITDNKCWLGCRDGGGGRGGHTSFTTDGTENCYSHSQISGENLQALLKEKVTLPPSYAAVPHVPRA